MRRIHCACPPLIVLLFVLSAAAESNAAAPASRSLADWYAMGGPIMHLLAACSVLVLAIALERSVALRSAAIMPRRLLRELLTLAEAGDERGALARCAASATPLAALAAVGIEQRARGDLASAERAVESAAAAQVARLGRNLSLLAALANLATLLGLLGTVLGMIESFETIALQGSGSPSAVAGGVFVALVTTAAGLLVGIPALALHALFARRIETCIERMEEGLSALLAAFDQPAPRRGVRLARAEAV